MLGWCLVLGFHEHFSLFYHSVVIGFDCFSVVIHCISRKPTCQLNIFFFCFNIYRIYGEDLVPAKFFEAPLPMTWAAARSKAVVLLLLIHCLLLLPLLGFCGFFSLFCYTMSCCRL